MTNTKCYKNGYGCYGFIIGVNLFFEMWSVHKGVYLLVFKLNVKHVHPPFWLHMNKWGKQLSIHSIEECVWRKKESSFINA